MRKLVRTGIAFSASLTVLAATTVLPAAAMSLRDAVAIAVRTNPSIDAAQASRYATDRVLDQAYGRYLPEVNLEADVGKQRIDRPNGFGPNDNDQWRTRRRAVLSFSQILFDGFERANSVYQAEARISAAAYTVLARSEIVALNVAEAYIDVVRHQRLLGDARRNVSRHQQLLNLVQARVSGGESATGDLEQTRERLQAARALVSQVQISLDTARARFKAVVGQPARKLQSVKPLKLGFRSVAAARRSAIDANPRLQALRSNIDVAGFEREKFSASLYPQINLQGSAQAGQDLEGTPGKSNELRGVVVLRWKLFDGGVRQSRIAELTERQYAEIAQRDAFVRELSAEVETAWSRATVGRRQVNAISRQLSQNRSVVSSYRNEYEANRRSLLDVLDAENSRFATEFDLSNARAIQRFATYQLAANTGRLLDVLGIQRPAGSEGAVAAPAAPVPVRNRKRRTFIIPPLK